MSDTRNCPLFSGRCECCGTENKHTAVVVSDSPVGPFCVSACPTCVAAIERGTPVPVALATALRLARQHAEHVAALRRHEE
jgi:hypothetical protein